MPIRDALLVIFFMWVRDRNGRNDKENGKSYTRRVARGLRTSCPSCHLCHWENVNLQFRPIDTYSDLLVYTAALTPQV